MTPATDILALDQEAFRAVFRNSPIRRAKLIGIERNAAVVLCNVGAADDADQLTRTLDNVERLLREHAARAPARRRASDGHGPA